MKPSGLVLTSLSVSSLGVVLDLFGVLFFWSKFNPFEFELVVSTM